MEDILEAYRKVKAGQLNSEVFSHENLNLNFSGGFVNLYDFSGEMPCGRYRLPVNEQRMMDFLAEYSQKIGELSDNSQYICGKCGGTFELPEATRDRFGAFICDVCVNGGDIRKKKEQEEKPIKKSEPKPNNPTEAGPVNVPSTVSRQRLTVEDSIQFLKENGYVIKKLSKSFKVVASDDKGSIGVTDNYYKSKEDFEANNPNLKFISIVKELNKSDEESLD